MSYSPCPLPPGSAVWVYLRDSGGESQDLHSQREKTLEYCRANQLRIVRVFEDAARSGSSIAGRDEFSEMIDLAQAGKRPAVAGIVCWDMARFSRSLTDAPFYRGLLERAGYRLVFVANFIPDGITGAIVKAAYDTAGALLLEQISYNSRRGLQMLLDLALAKHIPFWTGRVPRCFLGQQWPTGRVLNDGTEHTAQILIPDPATWEKGKLAFELRASRHTYQEIVDKTGLFDEVRYGRPSGGVANPLRGKGAETRVSSFLGQTIYKGVLTRKGVEYPGYVEAMVSPELWAAANAYRYYRGEPFYSIPHPKAGRTDYLLSGLLRCGHCGAKMYGVHVVNRANGGKLYHRWYYACTMRSYDPARCGGCNVSIRKLDPKVMAHLLDNVLTADFINDLWQEVRANWGKDEDLERQIVKGRAEVDDLKARIAHLRDAVESGDQQALTWYREREGQLREARAKLDRLQSARRPEPPDISREAIAAVVDKLRAMAGSEQLRERQLVLQAVIEKVEVWKERAVIGYKVLDNLGGICYNLPWRVETNLSFEIPL